MLVVAHPVVARVAGARHVKPAVGLEAIAVPVDRFVVRVLHAAEGVADRQLDGVAVAGRCAALHEVVVEPARRQLVEAPAEPAEVDLLGFGERLGRDVEVAGLRIEVGRIGRIGIVDVVGHVLVLDAAEHAEHAQRVEVVAVGREVLGPVDAHVLALVPGAVGVVLLDDVALLAGGLVVAARHVEMFGDLEGDRDGAVRARGPVALAVRVGDALVGDAPDQQIFGDDPLEPRHRLRIGRREQAGLRGAEADVDQRAARPKFRVVAGMIEPLADEEALFQGVGLHAVDGCALLGATNTPS